MRTRIPRYLGFIPVHIHNKFGHRIKIYKLVELSHILSIDNEPKVNPLYYKLIQKAEPWGTLPLYPIDLGINTLDRL